MKSDGRSINLYLVTLAVAVLVTGCQSPEEKRERQEASTLRLFLERDEDPRAATTVVPLFRSNPIPIRIEREPFLTEGNIVRASVVEVMGGFALSVEFDFHGSLVLENVSTSHRGRRIVVYSLFTDGRWLAAPRMHQRITDGRLIFTPDATREEAERLVRGLNNVAIELGNQPKPPRQKKSKGGST